MGRPGVRADAGVDRSGFLKGIFCCLAFLVLMCLIRAASAPVPAAADTAGDGNDRHKGDLDIEVRGDLPLRTFQPEQALGGCVDGMEHGAVAQVYTKRNIQAMSSSGYGPLAYRLRTELGCEAWHWSAQGHWSDPARSQGYWISDPDSRRPLTIGYGYRLPRRGASIDQANNDGYSRIDDGDEVTFWKSNPYLDDRFTGEAASLHPQWIAIQFAAPVDIDTIRICWGIPYATRYRIDYWRDADEETAKTLDDTYGDGQWTPFPRGMVGDGHGGSVQLRLSGGAVRTRFLRVWMTQSSHTRPPGSTDIRDGMGYAVREIYAGHQTRSGHLTDVIRHARSGRRQTILYVSSTDPWHRATDRDPDVEQPGFDLLKLSGLTHGVPALMPSGLIYDTPENSAAEIRWLRSHHIALQGIELGEEPDGQYISPEDYGALFLRWADALHREDAAIQVGGPGLQTQVDDVRAWQDGQGERSWVRRFINYLLRRGRLDTLKFFSFEWYPVDDVCAPTEPQPGLAASKFTRLLAAWRRDGVPISAPWVITEFGYSSFAARPEVDVTGALMDAGIVGLSLKAGVRTAYFYGLEPGIPMREKCDSWGNLLLFLSDEARRIRQPVAAYHVMHLLCHDWLSSAGGPLKLYDAVIQSGREHPERMVTAFALRRPQGTWSILILNNSPKRAWGAHLRIKMAGHSAQRLRGEAEVGQFSPAQYVWHAQEEQGYALPDRPAAHFVLKGASEVVVHLPPLSITVVQGRGG